ncbi:LLM class flavin-dependent oxidoreductase [Nonomuraea deserti]|uniref:LLM class flavin-dependent oxidoreductase n=1 Tax=Nonomuraea deserti TaxID=1848322 RepID=UPI001C7091BF|nr:LLM class flavin-dependent oxidoreductase [Nonomuraea deserti]
MLVSIVSGKDNPAAYGDSEGGQADRDARTKEFMRIVRRLWTEEDVTYKGEHFSVTGSTVTPRIVVRGERTRPRLYFGGASEAAERVAATEADVQLSDTPYLPEIKRQGDRLLPLLRERAPGPASR